MTHLIIRQGYHDEFLREMAIAKASGAVAPDGYDARSAAIDAQLYHNDPTYGRPKPAEAAAKA